MRIHTLMSRLLIFGAAVCASIWVASAQSGSVVIDNVAPTSGTVVVSGARVAVGADVTPQGDAVIVGVFLAYSWQGGAATIAEMISTNGVRYETTIPSLAAGVLTSHVLCRYTVGGVTNEEAAANVSYTISGTTLIFDPLRGTDFERYTGWAPEEGSYHTNKVGLLPSQWWIGEMVKWPVGVPAPLRPPGGTFFEMSIQAYAGAFIQTPLLQEGVGTIYFTSIMSSVGCGAEVAVQYTTNSTPAGANWQTAATLVYPAQAGLRQAHATPIVLNNRDARYVRLLRLDNGSHYKGYYIDPMGNTGVIYLDNLYVSLPPTTMTITEEQYNPGYPAQDQDVRVRCRVQDTTPGYPSVNRQVRVFYSWQSESGPWFQTNLYPLANDLYEGTIPQHGAGTMHYYFHCDFDGYYYGRDPDGAAGSEPFHSENQSPAHLKQKGDDTYRNYEIRRFRSDVQVMRVEAEPSSATVDMELIGDDMWQGLTLVSGITNLTWKFFGINGYSNDATGYDSVPWSWGDNDQDFPYPPIAGYAERNATNSIVSELEYDGFLLIRLNHSADINSYLVKRAVYQNFNIWTASPEEFEASLGLYSIQTLKQGFGSTVWPFDAYEPAKSKMETVDLTVPGDFVAGTPALTFNFWAYKQARILKERDVYDAANSIFVPRRAIELKSGSQDSSLWNTYASKTEGIDAFGFKARVALNDNYYSFFMGTPVLNPFTGLNPGTGDTVWPKAHDVEAILRANALSPGHGSVSILTWLSLPEGPFDPPSYYETRLTQADPVVSGQERFTVEVFRWKNGTATQIGATVTSTSATTGRNLTNLKAVRVETTTNTSNYVVIKVRVDLQGRLDLPPTGYDWNTIANFTDSGTERLTDGGTVGFISKDAQIEVQQLRVFLPGATGSSANLIGSNVDNWSKGLENYWYMGGKRKGDSAYRWIKSGDSLVRNLQPQTLGIYLAPMPDGTSMQPNLDEVQVATRTVSNLNYTTFSLPLKIWNESFVIIKNLETGEINAVVDELSLSPWRAVTRADVTAPGTEETIGGVNYVNWTPQQQDEWMRLNRNTGWLALEGWVTNSAGSRGGEVQFDRSRANTNLVQGLITPYLTNNIGSIAFDWRASGIGDVVFAIERTAEGAESTWVPVQTITNATLEGSEFLAIRTDFPGRIRVRVCVGTKLDGVLKIDNLTVRDNPPADDTSWKAYNALITGVGSHQVRAFEPNTPGVQTAYLNNSATNGTALNEVLDEHLAYVQTPKVGTGIGEIAFWYRIWNSAGGPGTISLQVAPSADLPDTQWTTLTNIVVPADQTDYIYYSDSLIYEPDNKVLRIYCLPTGNRVCIDNVLMTEPVRAGYEFRTVKLLPEQPVVGQPPGLEVEVGRYIMNPEGIRIFVSWTNTPYVSLTNGTAVWGYTNWWNKTYPRLELVPDEDAPRIYRLPEESVLPAGNIDDVVQFIVWGTHSEIDLNTHQPIVQDATSFTNAPWYYPVDLNAISSELNPAGMGNTGWSPYYFVYSCPPRSVWVNEIQYGYQDASRRNNFEFIEIIGPAGASLANWRIEMITVYNDLYQSTNIVPGFTLGNTTNGWGFLVWGDLAVASVLAPGASHMLIPDWSLGDDHILYNGGIKLIRSNGAWEDRVAWGDSAIDSLAGDGGFRYAGEISTAASLALASVGQNPPGSSATNFTWGTAPSTYGTINTYQRLEELETPPSSFFMVYSAIGPNGMHSVGENPLEMFEVAPGDSTNIVYTANEWFRIDTVTTNGVAVDVVAGLPVYTQLLANIQGDISNHVTFAEASPAETGLANSNLLAWVKGWYPNSEAAARADENIMEDYLFNLDPSGVYNIGFEIEAITVSTDVTVMVKLSDGVNPLTTTINGDLKVYGKTALADGTWVEVVSATVNRADFDAGGRYILDPFDPGSYRFFKAVIE